MGLTVAVLAVGLLMNITYCVIPTYLRFKHISPMVLQSPRSGLNSNHPVRFFAFSTLPSATLGLEFTSVFVDAREYFQMSRDWLVEHVQ
jgi:hypothetical protein